MNNTNDMLFFELLQVAIGNRDSLSRVPTPEEWEVIFEIAKKQTMVGIAFKGVERLPQEQLPPRAMIRQWFVMAEKIKARNVRMNMECAMTCQKLEEMGLHSCIIKGQANLRGLPPSPSNIGDDSSTKNTVKNDFCWYRTPGDIDVWTWSDSGKVADVIREVKRINPKAETCYHHAECNIIGETETEVHYRASWMCAPWRNKVAQEFFNQHKKDIERQVVKMQDGSQAFFYVPSREFDAVYQLVHIYRHLFSEGIGLRQMLDYYMVLKSPTPVLRPLSPLPQSPTPALPSREGEKSAQEKAMEIISKLGMKRFAGAVMWVLQEVFEDPPQDPPLPSLLREGERPHPGPPQKERGNLAEWMLCEPNEKDGRFLLNEIMLAGNFGHADERITVTREENAAKWGLMKVMRNMKFVTSYPEEVLCEPLFRVFHWVWRTFNLWRF